MGDLFLFILVEVPFSWSSYRVDVDQVNILVPSLITPFFLGKNGWKAGCLTLFWHFIHP